MGWTRPVSPATPCLLEARPGWRCVAAGSPVATLLVQHASPEHLLGSGQQRSAWPVGSRQLAGREGQHEVVWLLSLLSQVLHLQQRAPPRRSALTAVLCCAASVCLPACYLICVCRPQVARSRKYTPSQDDVGFVLKYECSIFDPNHPYIDLGRPMLAFTSRVRPAPNLPVRNLVGLPLPYNVTKAGPSSRFTVLSYNMLADLYAKVCVYVCQGASSSGCNGCEGRVARACAWWLQLVVG